jgi:hypothetical protein
MNKTVSVAEFTKQFGPLTNNLAAGESVAVTSYGQVHGRYVREGVAQPRKKVNLGERLAREEYAAEAGQELIDSILRES